MKGKRLPRKRRPNFMKGERIRINRGPLVGAIGTVGGVKKDRVWVEVVNPTYRWLSHLRLVKPVSLDRVR